MPLLNLNSAKIIYNRCKSLVDNLKQELITNINTVNENVNDLTTAVASNKEELSSAIAEVSNKLTTTSTDITLASFRRIAVIGDSFTRGSIYNPDPDGTGAVYGNLSWAKVMGRKIGAAIKLYAQSGASSKDWLNESTANCYASFKADTNKYHLYIIALGINDNTAINNGAYTGKGGLEDIDLGDMSNTVTNTFYGCYGKVIQEVQARIKSDDTDGKIVCLSVMRPGERVLDEDIKKIADYLGVPFVDLKTEPFFVNGYGVTGRTFLKNHPTAMTHSGMATAIERAICKRIYDDIYNSSDDAEGRKKVEYWTTFTERNNTN